MSSPTPAIEQEDLESEHLHHAKTKARVNLSSVCGGGVDCEKCIFNTAELNTTEKRAKPSSLGCIKNIRTT